MTPLWPEVNRWLVWFHRWVGVVLCLMFAVWFASGAILLFVPFPALALRDRLAASEPIDPQRVSIAPAQALARAADATELRLVSVAGRPMYLAHIQGGLIAIPADTDQHVGSFSAAIARNVADRF